MGSVQRRAFRCIDDVVARSDPGLGLLLFSREKPKGDVNGSLCVCKNLLQAR